MVYVADKSPFAEKANPDTEDTIRRSKNKNIAKKKSV